MDLESIIFVIAPLVGVGAGVVAQVVAHWVARRSPIVLSYAAGFLCGALMSLLTFFASGKPVGWSDLMVCLLTFGGLNYCYSNFVNLNFTSLRIRLLKELLATRGTARADEVARKYGSEAILKRRLSRLVEWGQLRESSSRFVALKGSFLLLALLFTALKRAVLGRGFRYETQI